MKYLIDISSGELLGPSPTIAELETTTSRKPFEDFLAAYDDAALVDTGLLPVSEDGLLAYRKAFGYEQFIYQRRPGIYGVKWGYSENDPKAKIYQLAHPYRILIADFHNGKMLGVRHFYSPVPVMHWDQELYATNLPNTNTTGYGGTSVGWVCLYHRFDTTKMTPSEKIYHCIERESGLAEPYNDANMSGTDGPRFYAKHKKPEYMWKPDVWQGKTEAEGFQWICNEQELIVLKVSNDPAAHAQSYDAAKPVYTLRRAAYEPYSAYYQDHEYDKPVNIVARDGYKALSKQTLFSPLIGGKASVAPAAKKKAPPPEPVTPTKVLQNYKEQFPSDLQAVASAGFFCASCACKVPIKIGSLDIAKQWHFTYFGVPDENGQEQKVPDVAVQEWETWCQKCVDDQAAYVSQYDAYFPVNVLLWIDSKNVWDLPENCITCPSCWTTLNSPESFQAKSFYVHGLGREVVACTYCLPVQDYTYSVIHDVLILNTAAQEAVYFKVQSEKEKLTFSSIPTVAYIDDKLCACKTLAPEGNNDVLAIENGLPICRASCLNADGKYVPLTQDTSVSLSDNKEKSNSLKGS